MLRHYAICCLSRACSILGRKEVLGGKASFGILGDGKELPQVALSTQFKKGDWRSGYYRDQTLLMALDLCSVEDFFAQLYADPTADPFSGARQMNCHYATRTVTEAGEWLDQRARYNISSDISSTAGQMARGYGLAYASKVYRRASGVIGDKFSMHGEEICWATIGDASTSEGIFWETLNAAGVSQVPLVVSVWDDGYGISVPVERQTTKGSISAALAGMQRDEQRPGLEIIRVKGWDYPALLEAYAKAARLARGEHVPVVVHVTELTQQLGHSTSGSHERYKPAERMAFEREFDCNRHFRRWILAEGFASEGELERLEKRATEEASSGRTTVWQGLRTRAGAPAKRLRVLLPEGSEARRDLDATIDPIYSELLAIARRQRLGNTAVGQLDEKLEELIEELTTRGAKDYGTYLYLPEREGTLAVKPVAPHYSDKPKSKPGHKILNAYFDELLARDGRVFAFGEDVGQIGDVNQGFAGLQAKHGENRVSDTGIREWSIVGRAIGLALRGLRPIAEVQYLDYLVYALPALTDDLASLLYRTDGMQRAPAIIRTRGHRLEGIWHSGSPMSMILGSLRGLRVCVPRNMTQAVGMYNTLLAADEPALVIECLNAYRLREPEPTNLAELRIPLGQPEVLLEGDQLTVVTYGACVRVAQRAIELLGPHGVSIELIDVQTLLPLDVDHRIVASLKKTARLLVLDEDVPGGASAYIMRHVLETQGGYRYLDAAPQTFTGKAHRPPYGSDGDYFSKPNPEDVAEAILATLAE